MKRISAMLMALLLVLQMIPSDVFADPAAAVREARSVITVSFGGTEYLFADGSAMETLPKAEERSRMVFDGWYLDGTRIEAPFTPERDMYLEARYIHRGTLIAETENAELWYAGDTDVPALVPVKILLEDKGEEPLEANIFTPAPAADIDIEFKVSAHLYALDGRGAVCEDLGWAEAGAGMTLSPEKAGGYCLALEAAQEEEKLALSEGSSADAVLRVEKMDLKPALTTSGGEKVTEYDTLFAASVSVTDGKGNPTRSSSSLAYTDGAVLAAAVEGRRIVVLKNGEEIPCEVDNDTLTFAMRGQGQVGIYAYDDIVNWTWGQDPSAPGGRTAKSAGKKAADYRVSLRGMMPYGASATVRTVNAEIPGEEVLYAAEVTLKNAYGYEAEPRNGPIQVTVSGAGISEAESLRVFRVDGKEAREIADVKVSDGWVTFQADAAGTYAVTQTIEQTVSIGGATYKITVTYGRDAMIPDGAALDVKEVSGDSYIAGTASALEMGEGDEIFYTKFLDIAIVADGKEIEPQAPVQVTVELLDVKDGAEALEVVHFGDRGAERVDAEADAEGRVTFTANRFSVYGFGSILKSLLSWTGDAVTYTLQGFNALLAPAYTAITVELEEGLEALGAYRVDSLLGSLLNLLYVKVSAPVVLGERESVAVYSVKNGEIRELLSEGTDSGSIPLGGAEGFAVVKDSGYRNLSFDLGDVTLSGMMPKAADAEATDVAGEYADFAEEGNVLAAFDISIDENGEKYQPDETHPVNVAIAVGGLAEESGLQVFHIRDDGTGEEITEFTVEDGRVVFEAAGFSVYIIIGHEGEEEIVTPRVEFHFVASSLDELAEGGPVFTGSPFNFVNTAGDYQTTQILKDGEPLEMIVNPPNLVYDNGDGTTSELFFYGWYQVNASNDNTELDPDTGKYTGVIEYAWPDKNLVNLSFYAPIGISVPDNPKAEDTLTWTIGDVSGSGVMDSEGRAHAYFAPLYENFYFVNFRNGAKEDSSGVTNSLVARKLVVFGSADEAELRIGDVVCDSPDPRHLIFAGWETVKIVGEELQRDEYYRTVDLEGNETENPEGRGGYYITVPKISSSVTQLDLYPVFDEARWLYFNTGRSGNGASYVGAAYRLTNDERPEGNDSASYYFDQAFFENHMSTRPGYELEGWYAFANLDSDGNITNLETPEPVTVAYVDENGDTVERTIQTTAIRMVNSEGELVYSGTYSIGGQKIFEADGGKLRFYKATDDLTLFARWTPQTVDYTVVYWLENADDDGYTLMHYKTMQGVAGTDTKADPIGLDWTDGDGDNIYTKNKLRFAHLSEDQDKDTAGEQAGIRQMTIEGDGSTIVNVYYDRDVYTLRFDIGFAAKTSNSGSGTWRYFVSGTTGPNYSSSSNWGTFLTADLRDLGTTNPFDPSEYTGTYSVNGIRYNYNTYSGLIYYYDITAKYGENIMDRYPGSQPVRRNGNTSYSFVGWLAQRDSYYNARMSTSIKGYFETVSEDLILTGGTIPGWNVKNPNANPNDYVAISVDKDDKNNTITGEYGITQEFHCRYTSLSGAKKYLYRIYLADPETLEYPAEPTDKFVITAGSGSYPQDQTPPTYYGYTMVDKKVLSSNGTESTPGGSYSDYAIPELTEAGVGNGMIMVFRFMPNEHTLTFKYSDNTELGDGVTYCYGQSLAEADVYSDTVIANTPPGYNFAGWYENPDGIGEPFDFNTTMPDGDIVLYAVYTPIRYLVRIDPNGGEIDHIDHGGGSYVVGGVSYASPFTRAAIDGERPSDSGYNRSQATYINAAYGTAISEYTVPRMYVPISDSAAPQYEAEGGTIYYYINTQYHSTDGSGLPSDCRNALYVTEDELHSYWNFYRDWTQANIDGGYITGASVLDYGTWRALYVSPQKYRIRNSNETWTFLGWFRDGASMPYNFSDPVTGPFTLTAHWRLDGGYTIEYVPDYTMPDGAVINGTLRAWRDPEQEWLSYADGSTTQVYKEPTELKKDGVDVTDDSVIFLGWRLVTKAGTEENPVYVPLESDGKYYDPSDPFTINAADAGTDSKIYFQAVYQYKESSDRRPKVKNLVLDANTGYLNTSDSDELPAWDVYPGKSAINTESNIVDGKPTQMEFGDIQSSAAVHLYKYASEVDLEGAHQFFEHPDGAFLLGFDDAPTEGDYIATYPTDSVIAITRESDETIYAVWEPMVYVTFVNDTQKGDVTFGLSASSDALQVINVVEDMYTRRPLADYGSITLHDGDSITLAFPYGAEKNLTISGTNTLGVGNVLVWNSSIDLTEDDVRYDTADSGEDVVYTHTAGTSHSHALVTGKVNNTKPFEFTETMIANKTPLTVTFTSTDNDYALVLDDNYPGGGIQEFDYSLAEITPEGGVPKTQSLPRTSTRIGYEFQGWAYDPYAAEPDYSASKPVGNPWTITDLQAFFSEGTTLDNGTTVRTLYAVWKARTDVNTVHVYKNVPAPGDPNEEFAFTVAIDGYFRQGNTNREVHAINDSFRLKHGWYLQITSSSDYATQTGHQTAFVQAVVKVFNENGEQRGTDATVRWERTNVNPSPTNGFTELKLSVTEAENADYDTSVTRNAHTETHPLFIGDSTDRETIPLTAETNRVYWDHTDASGTVVYTNTRDTHDIAVEKVLHSNTSAATIFSFTASYTLNGTTVDLGSFTVQSGTVNTEALKQIPAGAVLTITEVIDANDVYITDVSSERNAVDQDPAPKVFRFTVSEDDTVVFDNTLRSVPVTFRLVDQDGNPTINGMFSLASSVGSIGTDLYAGTTGVNPGVFYTSDHFWADTYTLIQTIIPEGYIGPSGPVTLTVTGSGIESSDDVNAKVTGSDTEGYVVTVINRATKTVTVRKILEDPLLSGRRTFGFSYSYTLPPETTSVEGTFTLAPVSNNTNGATYQLVVPIHANLNVTELTSGAYADVDGTYATQAGADTETLSTVRDYTISDVDGDKTVVFVNERKTQTVTVEKKVKGSQADKERKFNFTAAVKNGATVIDYDQNVFSDGIRTFQLSDGESIDLTVPVGVVLAVNETDGNEFETVSAVTSGTFSGFTDTGSGFSATVPAEAGTVKVTNSRAGHTLTVTKTVSGGLGDRSQAFTFTMTVGNGTYNYNWKKFVTSDGVEYVIMTGEGASGTLTEDDHTFTLKHHEQIVIEGLPADTQITLTEAHGIYTVSVPGAEPEHMENYAASTDEGRSTVNGATFTLSGDAALDVDNSLEPVSPTGYYADRAPWLLMLLAGVALLLLRARRAAEKGGGAV